ncbi:MAG: CRISPR system precrRNA processing endoribonuclease RAMP protein Cas6 [candidate division WOR-3 bacterium]
MFDGLYFSRLRFSLQLERPHKLREPLGRMLHGVLGSGLRRVVCPCGDGVRCDQCPTSADCAYSYIFESPPPKDTSLRYADRYHPHPYVIDPPPAGTDAVSEISFDVILVGRAIEYLPLVVLALERTRLGSVRARLREVADSAKAEPRAVFVAGRGFIAPPSRVCFEAMRQEGAAPGCERLTIRFVQPTLIQSQNRMVRRILRFETLLRALVRRLTRLGEYHCGIRPVLDKDRFYLAAEQVEIGSSSLRWEQEQGNRHQPADGLRGEVTYFGPLAEYLPILRMGEHLHVGKGTTIGLGRYELGDEWEKPMGP